MLFHRVLCLTFCFANVSMNSFFLSSFSFSNCLRCSWDLINLSRACSSLRWQSSFSFLLLALSCFLYSFSSSVLALSLLHRSSSHWMRSLCCLCLLSCSAVFLQHESQYSCAGGGQASPDGQDLQDSQILLRDLHLVQVNVAPGELAPHQVAPARSDRGGRLAVVPRSTSRGTQSTEEQIRYNVNVTA